MDPNQSLNSCLLNARPDKIAKQWRHGMQMQHSLWKRLWDVHVLKVVAALPMLALILVASQFGYNGFFIALQILVSVAYVVFLLHASSFNWLMKMAPSISAYAGRAILTAWLIISVVLRDGPTDIGHLATGLIPILLIGIADVGTIFESMVTIYKYRDN